MAAATQIVDIASRRPAPRVVAIDGRAGSGKTTFAGTVADEIELRTGTRPAVLHMDDLYPGWDGLAAAVPRLAEILRTWTSGAVTVYRPWDWGADDWGHEVALLPSEWLVVEGAGCGGVTCRPHLAALAWLEAPEPVRRRRAISRDGDIFRPHWQGWADQEAALFQREGTSAAADAVVATG